MLFLHNTFVIEISGSMPVFLDLPMLCFLFFLVSQSLPAGFEFSKVPACAAGSCQIPSEPHVVEA